LYWKDYDGGGGNSATDLVEVDQMKIKGVREASETITDEE